MKKIIATLEIDKTNQIEKAFVILKGESKTSKQKVAQLKLLRELSWKKSNRELIAAKGGIELILKTMGELRATSKQREDAMYLLYFFTYNESNRQTIVEKKGTDLILEIITAADATSVQKTNGLALLSKLAVEGNGHKKIIEKRGIVIALTLMVEADSGSKQLKNALSLLCGLAIDDSNCRTMVGMKAVELTTMVLDQKAETAVQKRKALELLYSLSFVNDPVTTVLSYQKLLNIALTSDKENIVHMITKILENEAVKDALFDHDADTIFSRVYKREQELPSHSQLRKRITALGEQLGYRWIGQNKYRQYCFTRNVDCVDHRSGNWVQKHNNSEDGKPLFSTGSNSTTYGSN